MYPFVKLISNFWVLCFWLSVNGVQNLIKIIYEESMKHQHSKRKDYFKKQTMNRLELNYLLSVVGEHRY